MASDCSDVELTELRMNNIKISSIVWFPPRSELNPEMRAAVKTHEGAHDHPALIIDKFEDGSVLILIMTGRDHYYFKRVRVHTPLMKYTNGYVGVSEAHKVPLSVLRQDKHEAELGLGAFTLNARDLEKVQKALTPTVKLGGSSSLHGEAEVKNGAILYIRPGATWADEQPFDHVNNPMNKLCVKVGSGDGYYKVAIITTFAGRPPQEILAPKPGSLEDSYLPIARKDRPESKTARSLWIVDDKPLSGKSIYYVYTGKGIIVSPAALHLPREGRIFLTESSRKRVWNKICTKQPVEVIDVTLLEKPGETEPTPVFVARKPPQSKSNLSTSTSADATTPSDKSSKIADKSVIRSSRSTQPSTPKPGASCPSTPPAQDIKPAVSQGSHKSTLAGRDTPGTTDQKVGTAKPVVSKDTLKPTRPEKKANVPNSSAGNATSPNAEITVDKIIAVPTKTPSKTTELFSRERTAAQPSVSTAAIADVKTLTDTAITSKSRAPAAAAAISAPSATKPGAPTPTKDIRTTTSTVNANKPTITNAVDKPEYVSDSNTDNEDNSGCGCKLGMSGLGKDILEKARASWRKSVAEALFRCG